MQRKPKVGLLTTFGGSDSAYSLVNVVGTQLQMLMDGEYDPILFVCPSFSGTGIWSDNRLEIRKTVSGDSDHVAICTALRTMINDIDVMICHDIVFLEQHKEWAKAVRILAREFPAIRWLHWQHSRGDHAPIEPIDNSEFCYPNKGDLPHVAEINATTKEHVHYVPHPLDFAYLGWPKLAIQIAEDFQFPFVDISMIYPSRLDRQKQVEKAIRVFAGLKRSGKSICLLVADAYATGERFKEYKDDLLKLAKELGLSDKEFAFLGETYDECTYSTPRPVVKALFEMSNIFLQVSNSETSSLVVMEAALAGNLIVLNFDFPPIHHLYRKAIALPFASVTNPDTKYYRHVKTVDGQETRIEDPQAYFDDQARLTIIPTLDSQLTISIKRQQLVERWPSKVFKDYLEPLILKDWQPELVIPMCEGDPEVTAIICTIDNLDMLKRQIPILMKEVGQIIVVNNGSKDGTVRWLEENLVVGLFPIHRENKGAGPGRNAGLALWDKNPTPYTLMLDGGILPPKGGVALCKDYLMRHPEHHIISPEVFSCFTTDENEASLIVKEPIPDQTFNQRCLSSTAYCLCRAEAWKVRFSEDGPFGEPGWGVDDNEMAYRWVDAGIYHAEFTNQLSGWKLYRKQSGSFKRILEETGIHANQYGSVYEKRNVKCFQDWRVYHSGTLGFTPIPSVSYIIKGIEMPDFARLVKRLHNRDKNCEILAEDYNPDVKWWLDTFALRWPWGDVAIDPSGLIVRRGVNITEEAWSGDVVRNRGPLSQNIITITPENWEEYYDMATPERSTQP